MNFLARVSHQAIRLGESIHIFDNQMECAWTNMSYGNGMIIIIRRDLWSILEHMSIGACGPPRGLMSGRFSHTIYVGNLPLDIREWEVEDLFYKYGRILDMELKIPPRPPCYCFVEFESGRDAEDAVRGRDGYNFDGCRLRVELAHGGRGQSSSSGDYRSSGGGSGRYGISLVVRGLPSSASWQDLKDHMRKASDVCFAQVSRDSEGTFGVVDYTNYEDMKYAIRKLDDTEFRNPWTKTYIRVRKYDSRSRSSLGRSVSRSASPAKPARSRSRSQSPHQVPSPSPLKPSPKTKLKPFFVLFNFGTCVSGC
ncbi:unnamed protein product [Lactuca saligna]|uniref:RRM domain-containing protein n=1 Tax=Lactuca saligna TaxID=75948 RepID=A0AA35YHT9_LACSI|nr:unnamed protein product [Lactuca saligna]